MIIVRLNWYGLVTTFTYDENGTEVREDTGNTSIRKAYDINNMMVRYKKYSGNDVIFTQMNRYNPDGQRIMKKVSRDNNLTSRQYHYLDGEVLYTTDVDNELVTQNLDGTDFTMRFDNNSVQAYLLTSDDRGSTTSVINSSNQGVTAYNYSDYGETEAVGNTGFENEVRYTGGIYDSETGEYYLNARYYDPTDARFTTMDTYRGILAIPFSLNGYNYCLSNPINNIDPFGNLSIPKKYLKKVPKSIRKTVKKYIKGVITKKKHYNRNKSYHNEPKDILSFKEVTKTYSRYWVELRDDDKRACHQFSAQKGHPNRKFIDISGHHEAVYYWTKNKKGKVKYKIVTDCRDIATYNYARPSDTKAHCTKDLIPYILWGNNKQDSKKTSVAVRSSKSLVGFVNGNKRKISKWAVRIIRKSKRF